MLLLPASDCACFCCVSWFLLGFAACLCQLEGYWGVFVICVARVCNMCVQISLKGIASNFEVWFSTCSPHPMWDALVVHGITSKKRFPRLSTKVESLGNWIGRLSKTTVKFYIGGSRQVE